ncbi:hypothetical protein [Roseovarius sp. MMSF_3281]|uniref:hypothetical protein n=1 Tax=Roseovarius sp. MMSF_3281 TaxID=3046694 RepID=UPI00273D659E|nr:hypothetical protein [Roseovarius sp. MMSF_3281]
MQKYDHAFTLGFSLISACEDASDVTHEMLREAIHRRLRDLEHSHAINPAQGESLVDACDAPFDTFEIKENTP